MERITYRTSLIRNCGAILIATVIFALVFGPALVGHVQHALNPLIFNDDVRTDIFPFFRYTEKGMASPDIPGDYYLALMPPGFNMMYRTLAHVIDPEPLSKTLPYLFLCVTFLGMSMAGLKLAGGAASLMTLALAVQTSVFFWSLVGGHARSFAFPLMSLGLWFVIDGRVRLLAGLAVVAQAFYPPAAALLGLMLAALLFVLPRADRGAAAQWSWRRRVGMVLITGSFLAALFVPVALAMRPWGRLLGPTDVMAYPEAGPEGRYAGQRNTAPLPDLILGYANAVLRGVDAPLVPFVQRLVGKYQNVAIAVLLLVLAVGLVPLAIREAGARRGLALPLAGVVGYVLARAFTPYLYMPERYVAYTAPLFIAVLLPASGAALAQALSPRPWASRARTIGAVLAGAAVLVLLGGRGDPWAGYTIVLDPDTRIYEFIRALPKDTLIAGWPGEVIDNVPYVCRQRAFVTYETHNAVHEKYVLEMRRRMSGLIPALFGVDQKWLIQLRDTFGVTHLIVNGDDFDKPPWYFAPFDTQLQEVWQRGFERGFAIRRFMTKAEVFREGKLVVLDLSRL